MVLLQPSIEMNKHMESTTMVPNRFGKMVKRCCASCQQKCYDDFGRRKCSLTQKSVKARGCCGEWKMSEQLDMIGCEHGKVQRREYQLTLMEVRASERLAMQGGMKITPKSLEEIRENFEKEHGSRFGLI